MSNGSTTGSIDTTAKPHRPQGYADQGPGKLVTEPAAVRAAQKAASAASAARRAERRGYAKWQSNP